MKIDYYAKNLEMTDAIQNYIEEKIGKLKKFMKNIPEEEIDARVQIRHDEHHRKGKVFECEVNMHIQGKLIRGEEKKPDLYEAIDLVSEELERQIKKYKWRPRREFGGVGSD